MKGPPLAVPASLTLDRALLHAARGEDGLIFLDLAEHEEMIPWCRVLQRAQCSAAGLVAAGVRRGDRVALLLPTAPAFVDVFCGCVLAGAVPVPLYPPVRLGRLPEFVNATTGMLRAVTARLVLTESRLLRLLGQVAEKARPALGIKTMADLDGDAPVPAALNLSEHDLALIQFSSGTTREPQPVALTHRSLIMQCAALKLLLQPTDQAPQRGVSWLPLYHDMGLIGSLLAALTYPGSLVLIRPEHFLAKPSLWLRAISRYHATMSGAPAFAFPFSARRIDDAELKGCDLSSWRLAICGAEHVSARGLESFNRRFAPYGFDLRALTPAYGLAEASLAVTACQPDELPTTQGIDPGHLSWQDTVVAGPHPLVSSGRPLAGMQLEVRDGRGQPLPERRCGRIFVRGPTLMAGYFRRPEATAAVIRAGWLDTGDLGFLADGELYVCGRAKDVIVVRGANHLPEEFEDCLLTIPGVRPGRAVAVGFQPPNADGEELLLLVEGTAAGGKENTVDLEQLIRRAVRWQTGVQPHTVLVLAPGTLPRTSSGKLRRQEARRRFLGGELLPPGSTHPFVLAGHLLRSTLGFARLRLER